MISSTALATGVSHSLSPPPTFPPTPLAFPYRSRISPFLPHPLHPPAGGPGQHDGPAIGQITLFKNGFKVGEGEFRPTADPKNEAFLRELKKG